MTSDLLNINFTLDGTSYSRDSLISYFKNNELYYEFLNSWFSSDDFITSYDNQSKHFINCLDKKESVLTSLDDGRNTLKVLLAAFKSSEINSTVKI